MAARARQVGGLGEALGQRLLGLAPRLLGRFEVDLGGHVRGLGHHHHLVGAHLHEPAGDGEVLLLPTLADLQLAEAERRDQWRVVGRMPSSPSVPGQITMSTSSS